MKISLHEEISQKSFKNGFEELMVSALYTGLFVKEQLNLRLNPYELNTILYNILRILRGQKGQGLNLKQIKTLLIDKSANISRCVDQLLKSDYVSRTLNGSDRREVTVQISPKGLEILTLLDQSLNSKKILTSSLSEGECQTACRQLEILRQAFLTSST